MSLFNYNIIYELNTLENNVRKLKINTLSYNATIEIKNVF